MRQLLHALRFLTIVPLPGGRDCTADDLAGSAVMFPLVGLMIGGLMAAAAIGLWYVFPTGVAGVLIIIAMTGISGGLHMDGLADMADGFFSSRPKDQILTIMKDSHIGAMGVLAIVAVLLLKLSALATLAVMGRWQFATAVFLMPLAGRCAMLLGMTVSRSANPDSGLGSLFCEKNRSHLLILWAMTVLLAAAYFTANLAGLAAAVAAMVVAGLFTAYSHYKIGGANGDTLGATCELAETTIALTLITRPIQALFF